MPGDCCPCPAMTAENRRYFRFDIRLVDALDDMDAAHRANVIALSGEADKIMERQGNELARLADMLVKRAGG